MTFDRRLAAFIAMLAVSPVAQAAPAVLIKAEPLHAQPYADAAVVAELARGTAVNTVERRGGWVNARVGGRTGWVRVLSLRLDPGPRLSRDGLLVPASEQATAPGTRVADVDNLDLETAAQTLTAMHGGRDPLRTVEIRLASPRLRIGKDDLDFTVISSHPGFLYVLMARSDGRTLDVLFPNRLDAANAIRAGQAVDLPRPAWRIKADGPAGVNQLLVMVTDAPRDFSDAGFRTAGPFARAEGRGLTGKDIVLVAGVTPQSIDPDCIESVTGTPVVTSRCSNAYGAVMMPFAEIE